MRGSPCFLWYLLNYYLLNFFCCTVSVTVCTGAWELRSESTWQTGRLLCCSWNGGLCQVPLKAPWGTFTCVSGCVWKGHYVKVKKHWVRFTGSDAQFSEGLVGEDTLNRRDLMIRQCPLPCGDLKVIRLGTTDMWHELAFDVDLILLWLC